MRSVLVCAVAGVVLSSSAFGWGADGHRIVASAGLQALPAEVPAFLRAPEAVAAMTYLAPEADREKGASKSFDDEHSAAHFVDVDDAMRVNGGPDLKALPDTRKKYDDALRAAGSDQYGAGYLPYAIEQGFDLLAKEFAMWRLDVYGEKNGKTAEDRTRFAKERVWREAIILHDLGYWTHFVGDGSQPLHATVHFNGWGKYPNPEGFTEAKIHSPFESKYVRDNIHEKDVIAAMPAYRDCACTISVRTAEYLSADAAEVVPLYRLEKQVGISKKSPEMDAFITKRLAAGAAELRDLIVDAWHHSSDLGVGYPPKKISDIESGKVELSNLGE
ncbi:hypothetical protein FHS83_003018 [Rhizomicrobium palustre]|uniref:S1/P1 Nuclease n=1 Tax=Rhizomicrobium palustre TaxID=189966 RepID=A0A846N3Q2_9PROT|nr:S1/P1 Nuclease [Rhizomicrobium palustre]NIK89700.1 hypothetical protein [Rhizomicrobium palustre]